MWKKRSGWHQIIFGEVKVMEKKVLRKWTRDEEDKRAQGEQNLANRIIAAIKSLRYGSVTIIVQDSEAIQIDKTERIRLK